MLLGLVFLGLTTAGLVAAIIGLCGIREYGTRGLLGKGIAGSIINGVLLIVFGIAAVAGFNKAIASRQLSQNLHNDAQDMQASVKQSYNPKTGITNTDFKTFDKMQGDMNAAAQTMSGDDALASQAMSRYLARMRSGMEQYHAAATQLRTAHILSTADLTDKAQIASRRQLLQDFMAANENLKNVTTNSETSLRADLDSLKISPAKIDAVMAGFDAKFAPRRDLDLKIRECDDRMAQSMSAILDLLETDWGQWHFSATDKKIYFDRTAARRVYQESIQSIKVTSEEQVTLQGELVNLP